MWTVRFSQHCMQKCVYASVWKKSVAIDEPSDGALDMTVNKNGSP